MNEQQIKQFNRMYLALTRICNEYHDTDSLRENSVQVYGVHYEDALEMAYDNIQTEAADAVNGIEPIPEKAGSNFAMILKVDDGVSLSEMTVVCERMGCTVKPLKDKNLYEVSSPNMVNFFWLGINFHESIAALRNT